MAEHWRHNSYIQWEQAKVQLHNEERWIVGVLAVVKGHGLDCTAHLGEVCSHRFVLPMVLVEVLCLRK